MIPPRAPRQGLPKHSIPHQRGSHVMVIPQCLPAVLCSLGLEASKLYFPGSPASLVLVGIWWETRGSRKQHLGSSATGVWGVSPTTVVMEMGWLRTSVARPEPDCLCFHLDLTAPMSPTVSRSWPRFLRSWGGPPFFPFASSALSTWLL